MTILSKENLVGVLDVLAEGGSVGEACAAIGGSAKSKILFKWLLDSENAAEFGAAPDERSVFAIVWGERELEWFHIAYREALADGKNVRKISRSELRDDLELRLDARRRAAVDEKPTLPPRIERFKPEDEPPELRLVVDHARVEPAPVERPSYAYTAPSLDTSNSRRGPPPGGFKISGNSISLAERRAGTVSYDESGIRRW